MWDVLDKFELGEIRVFPLFAYLLLQLLSVKKISFDSTGLERKVLTLVSLN